MSDRNIVLNDPVNSFDPLGLIGTSPHNRLPKKFGAYNVPYSKQPGRPAYQDVWRNGIDGPFLSQYQYGQRLMNGGGSGEPYLHCLAKELGLTSLIGMTINLTPDTVAYLVKKYGAKKAAAYISGLGYAIDVYNLTKALAKCNPCGKWID